jgi:membrane protease YdiL (CAAX protease family)
MATVSTVKETQSGWKVKSWLARYPLLFFFLLAYAYSWSVMLPALLGGNGLGLLDYTLSRGQVQMLSILFTFGPLISGMIMSAVTGSGVRALLRSYGRLRASLRLYLAVLIGPPVAILLGAFLLKGVSVFQVFSQDGWMAVPYYLLFTIVLFFIGGPLGEEAGWRGFALPRLERRFGALFASLILGVLWAGWHLLNLFIPEAGTWTGSLWLYLVLGISLSFLHTWVYKRTGQSLFMVTLFHATIDGAAKYLMPMLFDTTQRAAANLTIVTAMTLWAILIIVLARGRLGSTEAKAVQEDSELD